MDRALLQRHLMQVRRHIVMGYEHMHRQRAIVREWKSKGWDTALAVQILSSFEELQAMHIADRDRLVKELAEAPIRLL